MKTKSPSQSKRPGIQAHSCSRKSGKLLRAATGTAALILVFVLLSEHATAERMNACQLTADTVLRSCRRAAQSDYWLALAKCDNLANPADRERCQRQARADRNDARRTCKEQKDARLAACERLGGAPYDPVINPSNFVIPR